jgi:hypothetical protein
MSSSGRQKASFRINPSRRRKFTLRGSQDRGEEEDENVDLGAYETSTGNRSSASASGRRRRKRKEEKSVVKISNPSFSTDKRKASLYRSVHIPEDDDDEENEDLEDIDDSGHRALKEAQYLSLHDPLRYTHEDAFEMIREETKDDIEKEKQRQQEVRDRIAEIHHRPEVDTGAQDSTQRNKRRRSKSATGTRDSGGSEGKRKGGKAGKKRKSKASTGSSHDSYVGSVSGRASEDVDTDSEEDIASTYRKLGDAIRKHTDGAVVPVFPEIPEEGRRALPVGPDGETKRRRKRPKKSSRGRKRDGIEMEDTPSEKMVMTEDLWKVVGDHEDHRVFSGLDRDAPDMMKQNMGKTLKNLNTTIVSPLTVLDNMYVQSARTPEEIAVISQTNEWDAVQERMKMGKAAGIRHVPFVDRLSEEPGEAMETGVPKPTEPETDYVPVSPSHSLRKRGKEPAEEVEKGPVMVEEEGEEGEEAPPTDTGVPTLSVLDTVAEIREPKGTESASVQTKMSELTKSLIRKEKETKKIVSDARMVGLDIMMKGSVLEALMFFWMEAIQMRPGEEIVKTGPKGSLCVVKANTLMWNEQEIFSLCSQLVSREEQREIYRTHIKGLNIKEILEQNPSFGEPCDVNHDNSFLRPAVGSERPCRFGIECFLYSIGQSSVFPDTLNRVVNETAFPGREFYRPEEVRRYKNRKWPKRRRCCLMCYEMAMMYTFLFFRRDNRNPPFVIQNHWNKIEGENAYAHARMYPLEDNEKRWTGFVLPKVMRCPTSLRAAKMVVRVNGETKKVPCYVQASQNFR